MNIIARHLAWLFLVLSHRTLLREQGWRTSFLVVSSAQTSIASVESRQNHKARTKQPIYLYFGLRKSQEVQ